MSSPSGDRDKGMELYQPRSFFSLVLIGFLLVVVPLIVGLVNAARYVNTLSQQSQTVVQHAVRATQSTWVLFQQIIALERNATQYAVLGDASFLQAYTDTHRRFHATGAQLAQLRLDDEHRQRLTELLASEEALYQQLIAAPARSAIWRAAGKAFPDLTESARTLLKNSDRLIEREIRGLRREARNTEKALVWQAFALIPLTALFTAIFTYLISRPIRQMDRAIRRLGDGEFKTPVSVMGPRDLEQLGERLEWLRRRLRELEAEKKTFLRHVSHELKTPLSAIREGSELLREQVVGPLNADQNEIAQILHANCNHLQRLIEDLLNFNLAETRHAPMQWEELYFNEIVNQVIQQHKPAIMKKQIELKLSVPAIPLRGDRDKLAIVIDNLVSNAVKYTPAHGRIALTAREQDASVVLDVVDTGPGIDTPERDRVFEPFFQGKHQAHGSIKGTGLGLAIAKEYVSAHRGTLQVIGDARGAHLRVVLPRPQVSASEVRYGS